MTPSQNVTHPGLCTRCILPETFPGINFDEKGVCNHCRREEKFLTNRDEKKTEYRQKLDDLIQSVRKEAPVYDAVIAYSGGKDSSYTLKLLRERYNLRMLAFTFDNHFISPFAKDNIAIITDKLNVDLITFKPPWPLMKSIFTVTVQKDIFSPAAMLRASSPCTACIGIVKSLILRTALEMSIPLVAFGWSPGQAPIQSAIMKTNPALTRENQKTIRKAFSREFNETALSYLIPDSYYDKYAEIFPYNIHPLAFFDYNEKDIGHDLQKIGWKQPTDTDTNSTNCRMNALANQCHLERHHFHPYVWEIANMVRQGIMSREEGIEKIYTKQDESLTTEIRQCLEIPD